MGIFNFLKKKKTPIDFSNEKVIELTRKSELLGQTLIENGLGFHVDHLSQIRLAADNKNESEFRKLVLSRELFGGAGALWEIHIENPTEYKKFNIQFAEYIDLLKRMGIKNGRVNQIQKAMAKLN
ncbi:hypothetical protein AB9K26_00670 [Psychroserpens sp. XS_ASV72]|uniref:hypothetical protein n=1 Tax=Psychroserpens sp. XS_ASV72 TaxID=3241293 RepID=UPI003517A7C7